MPERLCTGEHNCDDSHPQSRPPGQGLGVQWEGEKPGSGRGVRGPETQGRRRGCPRDPEEQAASPASLEQGQLCAGEAGADLVFLQH